MTAPCAKDVERMKKGETTNRLPFLYSMRRRLRYRKIDLKFLDHIHDLGSGLFIGFEEGWAGFADIEANSIKSILDGNRVGDHEQTGEHGN